MPFVMTTDPADTATCQHGAALMKVPATKLLVGGKPVVTDLPSVGLPPCVPTPASQSNVPCTTIKVDTTGQATKLKVAGVPVLLATVAGSALPPASPGGMLIAVIGPKKLSAV